MTAPANDVTIRAPRQAVLYALLALLGLGQAGTLKLAGGTGSEVSDLKAQITDGAKDIALQGQMLDTIRHDVGRLVDGQAVNAAVLAGIQAREAALTTRVDALERAVFSK